jgi:hypothetical protein
LGYDLCLVIGEEVTEALPLHKASTAQQHRLGEPYASEYAERYWANPKAEALGWIRLIVVRFSRFALLFRAKHLFVAAVRSVEMACKRAL